MHWLSGEKPRLCPLTGLSDAIRRQTVGTLQRALNSAIIDRKGMEAIRALVPELGHRKPRHQEEINPRCPLTGMRMDTRRRYVGVLQRSLSAAVLEDAGMDALRLLVPELGENGIEPVFDD